MTDKMFITASEVAADLGISKPFAYRIVREMNDQLKSRGFMVVAGRVSRKYYEEKFYGVSRERKN